MGLNVRALTRSTRQLLVAKAWYFSYFASLVCIQPFLNIFFATQGLDDAQIGLLAALKPWVAAPAACVWSAFADASGAHKAVLLCTLVASTIVCNSIYLFSSFSAFVVLVVLGQALYAPVAVLADAAVMSACAEDGDYGKVRLWGAVGWGGFSTVTGWLVHRFGMIAGFIGSTAWAVPCILASWQMELYIGKPSGESEGAVACSWRALRQDEPQDIDQAEASTKLLAQCQQHLQQAKVVAEEVQRGVLHRMQSPGSEDLCVELSGLSASSQCPGQDARGCSQREGMLEGCPETSGWVRSPSNARVLVWGENGWDGRVQADCATAVVSSPRPGTVAKGSEDGSEQPQCCAPTGGSVAQIQPCGQEDGGEELGAAAVTPLVGFPTSQQTGSEILLAAEGPARTTRMARAACAEGVAKGSLGCSSSCATCGSASPCCSPVQQQPRTKSFWLNLGVLLSKPEVLIFMWQATVMGFGIGTIGEFLFLLLRDLGASETLMGLSLTVTCASEIPAFHYQGLLLKYIDLSSMLHVVQLAYVLRLALYAMLPWAGSPAWVLPVELLHGICFGLGWGCGTVQCKRIAPSGMEATMQGIFSGLYFGLGQGAGALVGGQLKQRYGGQLMFALASTVTALAWGAGALAELGVRRHSRRADELERAAAERPGPY